MSAEAFQIDAHDNVAILLGDVVEGEDIGLRGDSAISTVQARNAIQAGHKVAVADIASDAHVLKYGHPIGIATQPIARGEWVHLHNCRSLYDAASSALDLESGERKETRYV